MFKTPLVLGALVIAAVMIFAATRPDSFRVQRSVSIAAPPEVIFPLINNLHRMQTWSAWENVDPGMQRTHSGADSGRGAVYAWEGNREIGAGRMEIIASVPPSLITLRLDFIKPFAARNTLEFTLTAEDGSTRVTESISGPNPFLSKLMGLVFDMNTMIGGKFEESLAALKATAES